MVLEKVTQYLERTKALLLEIFKKMNNILVKGKLFLVYNLSLLLRVCEYLLERKLKDKDLTYDLSCSFVDIYLDHLRDLGKSYDKKSQSQYKETIYEKEDMDITENLSG